MNDPFDLKRFVDAQAQVYQRVVTARLVNSVEGKTIRQVLGSPDDLKYRSSMTLFAAVSPESEFRAAIDKYYAGEADPKTLELLGR
jgi:uncharacterized protein (DUF1810 family)